jgi:hypothetical protein
MGYSMKSPLLVLVLVTTTSLFCATPDSRAEVESTSPVVYQYWDWSLSDNRDNYQVELLRLALEKTAKDAEPIEIRRDKFDFNNARLVREVTKGQVVNIHAAPVYSPQNRLYPFVSEALMPVEFPLLDGLLGYRRLIVRQDQLQRFDNITREQLGKLVAGQGKEWEDVFIYRHNQFPLNESGDNSALLNMLAAGRFDYLPMSIIEVNQMLNQTTTANQLAVVEHLLIYYPLPVYFYLRKEHTEHAQRLLKGLEMAKADGSLAKLLEQHFGNELKQLGSEQLRVVVLEHPNVNKLKTSPQPLLIRKPLELL